MRRLCLLALILAVGLAFVGQAAAACIGGAPDGITAPSEECDPGDKAYAGRCTDDCVSYPIQGFVSTNLDGWDFYLKNATLRAFNPAANGAIDCARWFPTFVARANANGVDSLTCTLDGVADEYSVIHLRMNLIFFDDDFFKTVIGKELFVSADLIQVKAPSAWASVFPWWVGAVNFTVYSLDYALNYTAYHELKSRVWFEHYSGFTSFPLSARKISWIPDCIIAQGTYKWGNEDFNITTDLIPTIDLRGSSNGGSPTVPIVQWVLSSTLGAPAAGVNPEFDSALSAVQAAVDDANGNVEQNQVLQLPWYALAVPVASSGVNKYATWVFEARWYDTGSQIAGTHYAGKYSTETYQVTVYDSSIAPPTIVTVDSTAQTWANGPARTLSARAVSVCPGVDELTNYSTASLSVTWNWRNTDVEDYENTYLLPDAGATTATTTPRASFLPSNLPENGVNLDLYVAAGGKTLPVRTFIGPAPAPYKVNIRNGGGTHGRDADWTITASVQGIEIKNYELLSSNESTKLTFAPYVVLSCYAISPYTGIDLCGGLSPTNTLDVYTWTVPADLLFPGSYKFEVEVGRKNGSDEYIGDDDQITVTVTSSPPPEVAVSVTGFFSGRYTPVDPRVEQRIVNPLFNSAYTYRWTVGYGNPNDLVTSSDGQVLIIPKNRLRQGKKYEIRLTATDSSGNVGVAVGHFATKGLLPQVYCITPPGNRTLFNKMHLTCLGSASEFLSGPIRYQVRAYLSANFTVGDDSWLPLSGFSTLNDWDLILPYNIKNVTVYAEDQAGAYTTIEVDIPALPPNVNRTFSQTLSVLRGGISNAQRTGDAEALYNIGTALAAVLNGVIRNDTTDANRRELIRTVIAPDFVADLDSVATDSALRFVSYLTTRSDFLPDLPQRLIGQIFSWIKSNTQPIIEATDFELSDTLVTTLTDVLDRLSSPNLATIRDTQPLIDYQDQVEFIIDNFFQTQVPLPANRNFTFSGPVGNFKILISTYAPRGSNSTPGVFGGRDGANVTFTIPSSLWDKINASNPVYPIVVVVTDIGVNYYGYLPGVQPGAVLTNLVSLRFFDGNAVEIPINDTLIQVGIVTHANNTGLNILPAFVNETTGLWDSAGLTSRGTRYGRILRGRQEFVFTTTHLTTFTAFQADFIVTPPVGNLAQLADSDPNYVVTAILIIMASIGGGILLVVLAWLGVRLADQRTYHPVTNRSSLIRIREKKEVPTEEDYMSPSQSDSSMVSVHLRRPYYDNGLVIYEDEDSVRSHRSDDEGVDEDEPRSERSNASASDRSRSDRSRSRSRSASNASGNKSAGSRSPSRSRSPSPSNRSSPRSSAKSSPRD